MIHTSSSARLDYCRFHILDCPLGIWINTCIESSAMFLGRKNYICPVGHHQKTFREGLLWAWPWKVLLPPGFTGSVSLPRRLQAGPGCALVWRQRVPKWWQAGKIRTHGGMCKEALCWNQALPNEENLPKEVLGKEGNEFRIVEQNGLPEACRGCDQRLQSGGSNEREGRLWKTLCCGTLPVKYVQVTLS